MRIDSTQDLVEGIKAGLFKNIVITTHHKPDGDAMGSTLGLMLFLKKLVHSAVVITPTDYADFLNWLPGNDTVINFEEKSALAEEILKNADIVFCLDFNRLSRINKLGELIRNLKIKSAMFDHHLDPENFSDFTFWDKTSSSTYELVFEWIEQYFGGSYLDQDIANCFYTGLMTDTGNFQHNNTTPRTHRIAASLMEYGAEHLQIHERIFDVFSVDRSKLFGYCLYHKMEILEDCRTALMYLSADELKMFNVQTGDTEGLVNFGLSIKNIVFSVLIIDRTERVKMSFRSKGDFAANEFAEVYFHGGGHKNAAGGQSEESLEETVSKFKKVIKGYQKELLSIK